MKHIYEYRLNSEFAVFVRLRDVTLPVCVCENESYAKAITQMLKKEMPSKHYYYDSIIDPVTINTDPNMPLI